MLKKAASVPPEQLTSRWQAEKFICPRRRESALSTYSHGVPREDEWKARGEFHFCSWCGSLAPRELIDLIRAQAAEIEPTDKNYKMYVRAPGLAFGKFYTPHFELDHKRYGDEFLDLYMNRKIKFGFPGGFYRAIYLPRTDEMDERVKSWEGFKDVKGETSEKE